MSDVKCNSSDNCANCSKSLVVNPSPRVFPSTVNVSTNASDASELPTITSKRTPNFHELKSILD